MYMQSAIGLLNAPGYKTRELHAGGAREETLMAPPLYHRCFLCVCEEVEFLMCAVSKMEMQGNSFVAMHGFFVGFR